VAGRAAAFVKERELRLRMLMPSVLDRAFKCIFRVYLPGEAVGSVGWGFEYIRMHKMGLSEKWTVPIYINKAVIGINHNAMGLVQSAKKLKLQMFIGFLFYPFIFNSYEKLLGVE
jgi:hypothetical protein